MVFPAIRIEGAWTLLFTKHQKSKTSGWVPWWYPSGEKKFSGVVPGKNLYQFNIPGYFQMHHFDVFPLFPGGKRSKSVPGKKFEVHRVTWPGCHEYFTLNMVYSILNLTNGAWWWRANFNSSTDSNLITYVRKKLNNYWAWCNRQKRRKRRKPSYLLRF